MLPTISLVTCSYQQARFLDAAMRSVLRQEYPALEYVVVDGGSTDGSVDIIRRHAKSLAWWVSEPDQGQADALIKGFQHSSGEICGWLCSDDLLLSGSLARVGEFFRDHPEVEAVYGDAIWIDINGKPIHPKREIGFNRFVFLHDHNYVPQPSMFWRRGLYDAVGGLRGDFEIAMDTDLWQRFSARTRIAHMNSFLSCMRYYTGQKTLNQNLRARGQLEDQLVCQQGSPLAKKRALRPGLRVAARALRVVQKAMAGGYSRQIPEEMLPWLRQHATPLPPAGADDLRRQLGFSTSTGFMPMVMDCPADTVDDVPSRVRTLL